MAHDIFDYNDGWERNVEEDEVIDLEEEARRQCQELLAQQWREGELFVTNDYLSLYENPSDPSPIVCEFDPDTVILLASLKESHNYGGFRDVLLPIRGWIWTSVDEYDRAFYDASRMLKDVKTRETSTSMMRIGKFGMKQIRRLRSKTHKTKGQRADSHSHGRLYNQTACTTNIEIANTNSTTREHDEYSNNNKSYDDIWNKESRDYAFSDADIHNPHVIAEHHKRQKTNHLYVNNKQRKEKQIAISAATNISLASREPDTPIGVVSGEQIKQTNLQIIQSQHPLDFDAPCGGSTEEIYHVHQGSDPSLQQTNIAPQFTPEPPINNNNNNNYKITIKRDALSLQSSHEFSYNDQSREYSSKFRRQSHQVSYIPAEIRKIEKPISFSELDKLSNIDAEIEQHHIGCDSTGHIKKMEENEDAESKNNKITDIEQESLGSKVINSTIIRRTIHFIRSHPALLTLIYIGFTGFVEGIIFFDIITDILVTAALGRAGFQGFFALSAALIITPYFIAWSSLWSLIEKKRDQTNDNKHIIFKNKERYKIFVTLFSFAPCGVILLILFDCWIVFEFIIIRPLYFCCRFKLFRTDTFEELGYRKLRRVSEVCSETFFQALVQLWIILAIKSNRNIDINAFDVTLSLLASFFVIILWFGIILRIEASSNGVSLIEYLPIVLQGSFKFVPFLPAIEKGTKNGECVNWCLFKFDLNALSALGQTLGSPKCNLQIIKVSTKTFKKLPRNGCKYFGRLMNTALEKPINVIVSRLDRDLEELFELFDTANTKYFNFINFCRAALALRAQDNETLSYLEISSIFYELAAKKSSNIGDDKEEKVWLLDLMLKFRTSKQYISILDIEQVEDYCVKKNNVNLLTFCRAMGSFQSDNHDINVISAICQNKLDIAHALTEDDGIPIVVEIQEGIELLASYMNFHRPRTPISPTSGYKKKDGFPDITNITNITNANNNQLRSNLDAVQQYHRLNRLRKFSNNDLHSMDALNELFNDVSVYVSVAMCEIEKSTESTKETINQFWNEKLLFIIPYSVIEEIKNDATHTLARDTEHRDHHPQLTSIYSVGLPHNYFTSYHHGTTQYDLPPITLPPYDNNDDNGKHVKFNSENKNNIQNTMIFEDSNEEINEEDGAKHIVSYTNNTQTVHIINSNTPPIDSKDSDIDIIDIDIETDIQNKKKASHHTGLTQKIENIFQTKLNIKTGSKSFSRSTKENSFQKKEDSDLVPDESPVISPQTPVDKIDNKIDNKIEKKLTLSVTSPCPSQRGSTLDPKLFQNPLLSRGRESALRDSLHLNKFKRQSSIAPGTGIPHFEKKIYLDFNLFDDSNIDENENENKIEPSWDFQPTQSLGSINGGNNNNNNNNNNNKKRKISRNRRYGSHGLNKKRLKKHIGRSRELEDINSDSSDSMKSDSEEEEKKNNHFSVTTPKSPTTLNENAGIDGGEGTFLGSCHISINIDDPESLSKYHTITRIKEIKIGKKQQTFLFNRKNSNDENNKNNKNINKNNKNGPRESKLKFKIYCNALSAYLLYGKNYGDKITEQELIHVAVKNEE